MKVSTLLLLILIPLSGNTQESKYNKFSVGINLSPNYSYRTLSYSKDLESVVQLREENEHAGLGLNTGFHIRYSIFEKFEIELGMQFANQTHQFKNINYTDAQANKIGRANIKYNYNFIELPCRVNYTFFNKEKLSIYSTIGASANLFLNSTTRTKLKLDDGTKTRDKVPTAFLIPNKTSFSFIVGLGIGYSINDQINLRFEPIIRYSLLPLADAKIQQYNYSLGGQFSISRSFK